MKSKWLWALVGLLAVAGVFAGIVLATPPSGQSTTTLARAPFDPLKIKGKSDIPNIWRVKLKTHGASDFYVIDNTFAANGGTSGWHSHPGPPDLRRVRSDHELHVQRSPLHAAGLHRRAGVRGRRRRHGAQGHEQRQRAGEDDCRAIPAGGSNETDRSRRAELPLDTARRNPRPRRGFHPLDQELSGQLGFANNQGLPE